MFAFEQLLTAPLEHSWNDNMYTFFLNRFLAHERYSKVVHNVRNVLVNLTVSFICWIDAC